ncbi:head-tail adaptor protein [Arsenicitalea aurantiaca]|uniref:Head-tail adaptor protein n=1 Tax=Arsenicitalea aurantiaca TaxID=1783274 RepID=A0A433XF09_9HYPH|nr:phage head closure protein [Arsenicitalea aurantiaca]RUT32640.1 head-tail adaptor protein [Arsenicitalea aurantiaca]
MIDGGRRDRRIRLERAVETGRDAMNAAIYAWHEIATVWAEKVDVSDRERMAAGEVAAEITTRFRCDWSPALDGLNPKDRLVMGSAVFDIWGVKELGTREGLEITTAKRADK